jgi:hypothetical protein
MANAVFHNSNASSSRSVWAQIRARLPYGWGALTLLATSLR